MSRSKVSQPVIFCFLLSFSRPLSPARSEATGDPRRIEGGAHDLGCERFHRSKVANRGPDRPNLPRPRGLANPVRDQYKPSQPYLFRNQFSSNFTGPAAIRIPAGGCYNSINRRFSRFATGLSIGPRTPFLRRWERNRRRKPQHHRWGLEFTIEKEPSVSSSAAVTKRT